MVITDPQKRKQVQIEQITADLSQSVKALEAANNQIQKVISPEALNSFEIEKAKRQQVLTEKYKIVGDREVCKHLLEGACDEDLIAAKFLVNGLKDQALSTYRRGLEKKEMANLRLGIIRILFGAKRIQESDEEVIKARNLYPKDLRFQIYQEGIGKLRQLASTESRETVRLEVMEQIGDINEILAKVCMPKK